jgi:hypothetical protein
MMPADKLFGKDVTITTNHLNLPATTPPAPLANTCSHGYLVPNSKPVAAT